MSVTMEKVFLFLVLVSWSNAAVRENKARSTVSCGLNAMHVRLYFPHPFKGVVFTPDNYYNKTCSYASSPTSTIRKVDLRFPYGDCGVSIEKLGNVSNASVSLIIVHNRMLDTVYDYVQNVSCQLPNRSRASSIPERERSAQIPHFQSWITFQLGSDLFPEEVVEATGVGHELFLTYHVHDTGVYKDIKVMNCIGHDDLVVDERTKTYQIFDPYGCPTANDSLSSFSVMRNWRGISNLLAYAIVKNISMVTRGKFYITCGAKLCTDTCETNCDSLNRSTDPLYLSDMATKGMVNRAPNSKIPTSLLLFERGGRQRRNDNRTNSSDILSKYIDLKVMKLHELVSVPGDASTNENIKSDLANVTDYLITNEPPVSELHRSKRRVKLEQRHQSPEMQIIFIPSDQKIFFKTYEMAVLKNLSASAKQNRTSDTSTVFAAATKQVEIDKLCNIKKKCGFNSPILSSDRFVLNCALRTIVALFALLCFSCACYSLCFIRRETNNAHTGIMTYRY